MKDTLKGISGHAGLGRAAALLFACAAWTAGAATTETLAGSARRWTVRGPGGVADKAFTAATVHQDGFPAEAGEPLFWFDCSETNGWLFAEETGGTYVTNIPSKVGSRYLTLQPEGGHWRAYALQRPMFAPGGAKVGDRRVLDLGEMKSKRGLIFNPVSYGGGSLSNQLESIGTVITVFDASQGGGFLLGGGYGAIDDGWFNGGCMFLRGTSNPMSAQPGSTSPYNPVARGSTRGSWNQAVLRQNGTTLKIQSSGFGESWSVVSVVCTNNNLNASGVGVGDARYGDGSGSGGQRIAEMMVFGEVLPLETVAKIERWLHRKWFGSSPAGADGNAVMGALYADRADWRGLGFPIDVDVPAGETVSLYRNQHGRGGCYAASVDQVTNLSAFVKTGAGTLALCDAANFQGAVRLREGRLEVPQRAVPSALPPEPFVHLDASAEGTLVTETDAGTEYVTVWRNLDPAKTLADKPVVARPPRPVNRPALLRDALGEGLHVLDFGPFVRSLDGRYLAFTTDETSATVTETAIPQCMTVVVVLGAQEGGGHPVGRSTDSYFRRGEQNPACFYDDLFAHVNDGTRAYLNGVPVEKGESGFVHAGYQVYALRQAGEWVSTLSRLASWSDARSGGVRLAEVAVYLRLLTDEEMRDAQAHLMRKWLGRTAPGYARPASASAPALQNLLVEGAGEIHVPAGETLVVGTVSGGHDLLKTGAGTLKIQNLALDGARVLARGGQVLPAACPDVADACEPAQAPSAHFDPTRTEGMVLVEKAGGERAVKIWEDLTHGNSAFQYAADDQPRLRTADGPNGLAWVDCGGLLAENDAGGMNFACALNNVRAAYVVCRLAEQPAGYTGDYPMPLGSRSGGYTRLEPISSIICDFLRQGGQFVSWNQGCACAYNGGLAVDGVAKDPTVQLPTGRWQLLEYHPAGGAHVSAFGIDRGNLKGGFGLGEVLLYERPLTAREKVATRNYLMRKWLGTPESELAALPPADLPADFAISVYSVDGTGRLDVGAEQKVQRLTGAGRFEKSGAGALTVGDWSAFTGMVDVAAGTLAIGKSSPGEPVPCVTDGLFFQADASQGVRAATNEAGIVQIEEWASALGDGWTARPAKDGAYPTWIPAGELNGARVVDMALERNQALVFYKDGVRKEMENIRSAFWMIGSQNGGGFLMGGGYKPTGTNEGTKRLAWHRGGGAGFGAANAGDAILNGSHAEPVAVNADWRKNRAAARYTAGLSGAWDLLSMNTRADAGYGVHAEGFAFDGRYLSGGGFAERLGAQRLAEVLLYDRRLTDAEIAQVEAYLCAKWQFGQQAGAASQVDVRVAADATLDLGGGLQVVGSVTGAGSVVNGALQPERLVADGLATAWPSVEALQLTPRTTVELVNLAPLGDLKEREVKILDAASVTGLASVPAACFTGESLSPGLAATLVSRDGALYVRFKGKGMALLFR